MLSCGHEPSPHGPHTTGTAVRPDTGAEICWDCADNESRDIMRAADRFVAYLSGDAKTITTWSGGKLGDVLRHWTQRVGFGGHREYVQVRDVNGRLWSGNGPGAGMFVRLRARKSSA